ncbi:MAG: transcription termination/antitermination protein NusG [Deltaproteobacteria bacterium]|nr:transcription termination/antitermination protein NusG [Deltaproteobacteria bacterium]
MGEWIQSVRDAFEHSAEFFKEAWQEIKKVHWPTRKETYAATSVVLITFSGYEQKAKAALEERIKTLGKQEYFGEILVPVEKVVELVKGKKKTSSRKFFPGYILVQMELNKETWHVVKETPKVTGFVGEGKQAEWSEAPSVTDEEVKAITQQMEEGAVKPKPRVLFSVGESVKVVDGPFADFNGVVEDVRPDKGKLRVLISIFGRATPVELEFVQVERN